MKKNQNYSDRHSGEGRNPKDMFKGWTPAFAGATAFGVILLGSIFSLGFASPSIEISPSTFDFGWCPDNAKIACDVTVKNTTGDMIPLNAVQPSCGCTATNFTPVDLPSSQEQKIQLTFNTRGYNGVAFNKPVQVKAGSPEVEYTVRLAGHVLNPGAMLSPVGTGIASFEAGVSSTKEILPIQNKSDHNLSLVMVQEPASWAKVKLKNTQIEAGKTVDLEVSVDKPTDEARETSVTFEAMDSPTPHRVTLAIRTGPTPAPVRRIQPPAPKIKPSGKTNP